MSVTVKRPISYIAALQGNKNNKKSRNNQQPPSSSATTSSEGESSSRDSDARDSTKEGQFGAGTSSSVDAHKVQDVNMD